jgi:hypothetical protein
LADYSLPHLRALRPMIHERLIERRVVSRRLVYLEAVYLNAICPPLAHPPQISFAPDRAGLCDYAEVLVPDEDEAVLTGQLDWLFLGPQNRLCEESGKVFDDTRGLYARLLMEGAFRTEERYTGALDLPDL